ncbi:HAD-IIB family hydrolase [Streptomyces pinistramenti]|uniref:HAD-IIB family hydrolase n=1 Tax=Streptomyces pinistramenti TaxID=2884812 RepID=UPI001D0983BD|nr:HAD-IIB family hydrolase [Streptomyces pinistramenti]MCB5908724.1 HAD-IIB family hydrolase [Streptomyces pinistramenti]
MTAPHDGGGHFGAWAAPGDGESRVLVTDLDGTLLGGSAEERRRLRAALERHPEITLVFATGRGIPSVQRLLADDPLVPRPRWIIADVGASVVDAADLSRVDALESRLRTGWPGAARVRAALARFPALVHQRDAVQSGRCSFYLRPQDLTQDLIDAVTQLGCVWGYSADRYFDVLPPSAGKGSAVTLLARELRWPMASVLVAGDSLNDLSLFGIGAHGVVMGNAEPALKAQLAHRRDVHAPGREGAAAILDALHRLGWVARRSPVVIGYHRPPVRWADGRWQPPLSPNGILPTLCSLFGAGTDPLDAVWATALVEDDSCGPRPTEQPPELPLAFLPLPAERWARYFHSACKETLWPVLMSQPGRMRHEPGAWADYEAVNAAFARHIGVHADRDATVWLHDYNLWLVPGILRAERPDLRVGLFHHTPFPPPATFALLPHAEQLRASLACLDWAGFHTADFARHFEQTLATARRVPRTGVHPLGIDRRALAELARSRPVPAVREDRSLLVLSVERLDYAKAPLQKIHALNALFAEEPGMRGRVRFRLVCPPPEPGLRSHDGTRTRLEEAITQLNKRWRRPGWEPVEYLPLSLPFPDVVDHYLAADVFWVTSLADGMNLTAKEFVAAQAATGRHGVLVLSRHAGAARQLASAALLTDPRSPRDLTRTLHRALTMTAEQRASHMARLAGLLDPEEPDLWARRIITAIHAAAVREPSPGDAR